MKPTRATGCWPPHQVAVDSVEREVDRLAPHWRRGSRIQQVVNELRGEKIDVIRWSPDPGQYIANSQPSAGNMVRLVDPEVSTPVLVPPIN